jgi:hypothetical protein
VSHLAECHLGLAWCRDDILPAQRVNIHTVNACSVKRLSFRQVRTVPYSLRYGYKYRSRSYLSIYLSIYNM